MCHGMSGRTHVALLSLSLLLTGSPLAQEPQEGRGAETGDTNVEDEEAIRRIREAYLEMGYCFASVTLKESGAKTKVFEVQPRRKCSLKDITITGAKRFHPDQLLQNAPKPGDVVTPSLLRKLMKAIVKKYSEAGAPLPTLTPDITPDRANASISLKIHVEEAF